MSKLQDQGNAEMSFPAGPIHEGGVDQPNRGRRLYASPRLTVYGDLAEVTQSGATVDASALTVVSKPSG